MPCLVGHAAAEPSWYCLLLLHKNPITAQEQSTACCYAEDLVVYSTQQQVPSTQCCTTPHGLMHKTDMLLGICLGAESVKSKKAKRSRAEDGATEGVPCTRKGHSKGQSVDSVPIMAGEGKDPQVVLSPGILLWGDGGGGGAGG